MRSNTPTLDYFHGLGFEVTPGSSEGRIRVVPARKVTPELQSELVRLKPILLAELALLSEPVEEPSAAGSNWWVVTSTGEQIALVEKYVEPSGEILEEWHTQRIRVPSQIDPSFFDVWCFARRVDGSEFKCWLVGREPASVESVSVSTERSDD